MKSHQRHEKQSHDFSAHHTAPTAGALAPPEIDGRTMILSFDKTSTHSPDLNDPTRAITLNALATTAFPLSLRQANGE